MVAMVWQGKGVVKGGRVLVGATNPADAVGVLLFYVDIAGAWLHPRRLLHRRGQERDSRQRLCGECQQGDCSLVRREGVDQLGALSEELGLREVSSSEVPSVILRLSAAMK